MASRKKNPEAAAKSYKKWYEANKETLLPKIRIRVAAWAKANPARVAETQKRARSLSPEKYREHQRNYRAKLREEVFSHYGSVCSCCKESRPPFLTIDHINGGGSQHNKTFTQGSGALYRQIKKNNFPDIYRILCFNCNCGRHYNSGICPHIQSPPLPNNQHYNRKKKILEAYGSVCNCCKEQEPRFLCVDHVLGTGAAHRKATKNRVYEDIVKRGFPPDEFQILCYNCNCGKKVNKGICPHLDKTLTP